VAVALEANRGARSLALVAPPLIDIAAFCLMIGAGQALRESHIAAFVFGVAATWVFNFRVMLAASPGGRARHYLRLMIVTLMALFLRGGVLGLLVLHWQWPAQLAIVFAVAAGLAVTMPGFAIRSQTFAVGVILYAVSLRLVYAGAVDLLPEETYYWSYARHLDFGYLDHPPVVAWLIGLWTWVLGQTEFAVRAGALCCGAITSLFVYRLARNAFGKEAALVALVLAQALPFFFLSGLLMTPDAALTAAWAASLYFLERALIAGERGAWWRAGLCLGIGLISKYSIGLLAPVILAFMLWDSKSRQWWRRPEPYLAALLASAVFLPVIVWNAQHEWASFAFQTSRRLSEAPQFALHKLIASILILITPTAAISIAVVLAAKPAAGDAAAARLRRFMALAILIPLSVFALFSLRHEVKLDWTGALWTAALPLLACAVVQKKARAAWVPTVAIMMLIYGAGLHYLVLGWPGLGYSKHIEAIPVGWRDLSSHIMASAAAFREETASDVLIVGMDRYAIASEIAFYGERQTHTRVETVNGHIFEGMQLMYGQWMPAAAQERRNLLLVAWDPSDLTQASVVQHVQKLGPIEDEVLTKDGVFVRHYYHRFAYGYQSIAKP
jgi:dolichol-phosphate mannosyltransferase